ncbi:MAG: hypothetical protein LWW86_03100 [Micrococcales bacterium]|nr:hypothetical protein [Micrococcales bacterium]
MSITPPSPPFQQPQQPSSGGLPPQPGPGGYGWPAPSGYPAAAPPAPGRSLAITAIVLSVLALLASLAALGSLAFGGPLALGGGMPPMALMGQIEGAKPGARVSGGAIGAAVQSAIREDGGSVTAVQCPDIAALAEGSVAMCSLTADGLNEKVLVVLEHPTGEFVLVELDAGGF